MPRYIYQKSSAFQSTLPAWGATMAAQQAKNLEAQFQSTLPAWGATSEKYDILKAQRFQSTLPAWGATYQAKTYSITS